MSSVIWSACAGSLQFKSNRNSRARSCQIDQMERAACMYRQSRSSKSPQISSIHVYDYHHLLPRLTPPSLAPAPVLLPVKLGRRRDPLPPHRPRQRSPGTSPVSSRWPAVSICLTSFCRDSTSHLALERHVLEIQAALMRWCAQQCRAKHN